MKENGGDANGKAQITNNSNGLVHPQSELIEIESAQSEEIYMKHRDFTVAGLAEEVHKSEQAVRESFASMMESPSQTTKKMIDRLRLRRSR